MGIFSSLNKVIDKVDPATRWTENKIFGKDDPTFGNHKTYTAPAPTPAVTINPTNGAQYAPIRQPTTPIYGAVNQAYGGGQQGYQNYLNSFYNMLHPQRQPVAQQPAPTAQQPTFNGLLRGGFLSSRR